MNNLENKPIELITQPDGKSCVYACIAMIARFAGRDVTLDHIRESMKCGGRQCTSLQDEFMQWVRLGFLPKLHLSTELCHGEVCLLTVPSLNTPKLNHRIIVDLREDFTVLDPNRGRRGVKVYRDIASWSEKTTLIDVFKKK